MWEVVFVVPIVLGILMALWVALGLAALCAGMIAGEVVAQGVKLPLILYYELSGKKPNIGRLRHIIFFLGIFWLFSGVIAVSGELLKSYKGDLLSPFLFGPPILVGFLTFFAATAQRATEELG